MQKEVKILGWELEEIKSLVNAVKNSKSKNLVQVFETFAKETSRKTYSVRNFYYRLIKEAQSNAMVGKILKNDGILKNLNTNHFSEQETRELMRILLKKDGNSLRRACYILAKGNKSKMVRIQNKYRNTIKNRPELVQEIINEYNSQNIETRKININNIITLPKRQTISKGEIESLFLGLVRLVKESAKEEVTIQLKEEIKNTNYQLEKSLISLRRKDVLIKELKEQNLALEQKLKVAENNYFNSQKNLINGLKLNEGKLAELKQFFENLHSNETKKNKK